MPFYDIYCRGGHWPSAQQAPMFSQKSDVETHSVPPDEQCSPLLSSLKCISLVGNGFIRSAINKACSKRSRPSLFYKQASSTKFSTNSPVQIHSTGLISLIFFLQTLTMQYIMKPAAMP